MFPLLPRHSSKPFYQTASDPLCVLAAGYASVVARIRRAVALGAVTRGAMVRIGVGYMGLVALAVITNSLTLRLPLIYYKQRRSKVCLLFTLTPLSRVSLCGGGGGGGGCWWGGWW